jgi:hypothetical protein
MDRTRRGIFGHGDLDRYSLAELAGLNIAAGLECRKCRKFAPATTNALGRVSGAVRRDLKRAAGSLGAGVSLAEARDHFASPQASLVSSYRARLLRTTSR